MIYIQVDVNGEDLVAQISINLPVRGSKPPKENKNKNKKEKDEEEDEDE